MYSTDTVCFSSFSSRNIGAMLHVDNERIIIVMAKTNGSNDINVQAIACLKDYKIF